MATPAALLTLPPHLSCTIEHNPHKVYYQSVLEYVENTKVHFVDAATLSRCIKEDELWTVHWCPTTPVGSYEVGAPTLEEALKAANA